MKKFVSQRKSNSFANADGGLLAIGIEDNGEITGIDCIDSKGRENRILLIRIPQSGELHANHRDEVFLRVGDKSKKVYC